MESERYYPFEHKDENKEPGNAPSDDRAPSFAGKGRRGGNAAASAVIHSGRVTERSIRYGAGKTGGGKAGEPHDGFSERGRDGHNSRRDGLGQDSYTGGEASAHKSGTKLKLKVSENTAYGSFLELPKGGRVLLPFAEQPDIRPAAGDEVEVTLYEDKGGRLTATMRKPILSEGETGVLTCAAVTGIGVFVDNGMPKQVLVPFRELLHTPSEGESVLVFIYRDKSGREAATMRVYRHLHKNSQYKKDDTVEGFVYEVNRELGVFVAVDDRYYGMIPASENFEELRYGDRIFARVSKVREDGKLDLLLRERLHSTADRDSERIIEELKRNGGLLPYADKADAETIKKTFSMSKNQFKRALGHLYKKRLVDIDRGSDTVRLIDRA